MTFTNIEIKEIKDKLKQLENKEQADTKVIDDARRKVASDWWDTKKQPVPTTRDEALTYYRYIEGLIKTETDRDKLSVLRQNLKLANEKFKEIKRNV